MRDASAVGVVQADDANCERALYMRWICMNHRKSALSSPGYQSAAQRIARHPDNRRERQLLKSLHSRVSASPAASHVSEVEHMLYFACSVLYFVSKLHG